MERKKQIIRCEHLYDGYIQPVVFYDPNGNEYEFCSEGCMHVTAAQYKVRFSREYEENSLADRLGEVRGFK